MRYAVAVGSRVQFVDADSEEAAHNKCVNIFENESIGRARPILSTQIVEAIVEAIESDDLEYSQTCSKLLRLLEAML